MGRYSVGMGRNNVQDVIQDTVYEASINAATDKIVKASCCLHNFLMRDFSLAHDVTVETSRGMQNISNCPLGRMPTAGMNVRGIFARNIFFPRFHSVLKRLTMISKIYISFKFNLLIQ